MLIYLQAYSSWHDLKFNKMQIKTQHGIQVSTLTITVITS